MVVGGERRLIETKVCAGGHFALSTPTATTKTYVAQGLAVDLQVGVGRGRRGDGLCCVGKRVKGLVVLGGTSLAVSSRQPAPSGWT